MRGKAARSRCLYLVVVLEWKDREYGEALGHDEIR
jgi:hypothetical protein